MSKIFPIDNYYPTNADCNDINEDELPKYYYYISGRQQVCIQKLDHKYRVMVKNYEDSSLFPDVVPRGDKFYPIFDSTSLPRAIYIFRKVVSGMLGLDNIDTSIVSLERISQYLNDYISLSKKLNY